MSNFLSIAAVTATLQRVLQKAIDGETGANAVGGATVMSVRPGSTDIPKVGVNVFLYQPVPNGAFRAADVPRRDANGALTARPRAALNLHYLLTFHGAEKQLEPQRLLGVVVRALHGTPVLTQQQIDDMRTDPKFSYVAGTDLAAEVERVKLTPLALSFDEMSRIWSVFPTTDYSLSAAFEASVVFIEGRSAPRATEPVQERTVAAVPTAPILIESVEADDGGPIVATSTIVLRGRRMLADVVHVRVAGVEVSPATARDRVVTLDLPAVAATPQAVLGAGVQGIQLVHPLMLGNPPASHAGVESAVATLVLRPLISAAPTTSGGTTAADGTRSATVTVPVSPRIQPRQRAQLLLRETGGGSNSYTFDGPQITAAATSVAFNVAGVVAATFEARVVIDGAASPSRDAAGNPISNTVTP